MAQPMPFNMKEKKGSWWAKPEPFITLPSVVASVCGHTLDDDLDATLPPGADSIPAADITHCSDCTTVDVIRPGKSPIAGIPTVVGSICCHALGGITTPIGPNTVPSTATPLCATCNDFSKIAHASSASHKQWQESQDSMKASDWMSNLQEEVVDPIIKEYRSRRKGLARKYERLRVLYEMSIDLLLESVNPALPIVDLNGVVLLPLPEHYAPQAKQTRPRRVTFDEDQHHPSRETARTQWQFNRTQPNRRRRGHAYEPGRYADLTGRGWENTSSPVLYQSGDGYSEEDTPARRPGAGFVDFLSTPLVVYTPSSLPASPEESKKGPEEESSVSEK